MNCKKQLDNAINDLQQAKALLQEYKEQCDKLNHSLEICNRALHQMARIIQQNSMFKFDKMSEEMQEKVINDYIYQFISEDKGYKPRHMRKVI